MKSFEARSTYFGAGRDWVPSAPATTKLADNYGSDDDGLNRTPPLLPRIVNLKPSPSPEYLPQRAQSSSPERSSKSRHKGRRPKTQPSQGDEVLIGLMGDLNNPEIAISAGREPLNSASQSEADDEVMQPDDHRSTGKKIHSLMQTARDGLDAVDGNDVLVEDPNGSSKSDSVRRVRPTIQVPLSKESNLSDDARPKEESGSSHQRAPSDPKIPVPSTTEPSGSMVGQYEMKPAATSKRHSPSRRSESFQATRSPDLRKYAIPASVGSPKETLPAMKDPSSALSSKSPTGQQSLPPLHAINLEPLNDDIRANNLNHRQSFPLPNGSLHSPPMSSIASKMSPYPSRITSLNGHFPPFSSNHPSPVTTFNESPRELYRPASDPTSMSPPGKPNQPQNPSGRISQSEESAPLSAESYTSTGTFSSGASSIGDQAKVDGNQRTLPPLGSGPLMTGIFKCDHSGCTAPPFQTQYLLKWVSLSFNW